MSSVSQIGARTRFGKVSDRAGRNLAVLTAEPPREEQRGAVVIATAYERRIHHYAGFSHALVSRGLATLRFDLSNHVGLSDGDIVDLTMSSIASDVGAALQDAATRFPELPITLLAPSLTARASLRALADIPNSVKGAALILPVVDVQATIAAASGTDLLGDHRRGAIADDRLLRVVDHDVATSFSHDAWDARWIGLESTITDVERAAVPMRAIVAERDDWVDAGDASRVLTRPGSQATVLEASSHDLAHNFPIMREVLRWSVDQVEELLGLEATDRDLPPFDEMLAIVRQEREWAKGDYADVEELT